MGTSKQFKIQADAETITRLHQQAETLGQSISGNAIASMAAFEISRVPATHLWEALGSIRRIATATAPSVIPPRAANRPKRADEGNNGHALKTGERNSVADNNSKPLTIAPREPRAAK